MTATPKNILYVRADSFGDLILFTPALSRLIKAWPGARHTLLVRPGYDSLQPLFPTGLHWKIAAVNPFKESPAAARETLKNLLAELEANPPDLIVAATLSRTWLEVAIAARFPLARRVALGHGAVDPLFAMALELELGVKSSGVFPEVVETDLAALDWENNHRIADHLLGQKGERTAPALALPAPQTAAAAKLLSTQKFSAGDWVACYPAGVANVTMKAWPAAKFAETVTWLQREHGFKVMLLGHRSEAAIVNEVADLTAKAGGTRPVTWLSQDGEIPLMAALLATAKFYFGNDTGPMHVSAAVGVPTIGLFGGGYWPRFKPVGRQVISVVQPLSCFGCAWDCQFGDAPCVKTLGVADVQGAVARLLAAKAAPLDLVVDTRNLSADALALIAAVTPRYHQLQSDRLDRQHKIEELTHLGQEKDVENTDLKRAAEERKAEMEAIKAELEAECATKDTEIAELKGEADTKDLEIASLKREADTKDAEIASLKGEANTKDAEIAQLKREADTKDAEIEQLKAMQAEYEDPSPLRRDGPLTVAIELMLQPVVERQVLEQCVQAIHCSAQPWPTQAGGRKLDLAQLSPEQVSTLCATIASQTIVGAELVSPSGSAHSTVAVSVFLPAKMVASITSTKNIALMCSTRPPMAEILVSPSQLCATVEPP